MQAVQLAGRTLLTCQPCATMHAQYKACALLMSCATRHAGQSSQQIHHLSTLDCPRRSVACNLADIRPAIASSKDQHLYTLVTSQGQHLHAVELRIDGGGVRRVRGVEQPPVDQRVVHKRLQPAYRSPERRHTADALHMLDPSASDTAGCRRDDAAGGLILCRNPTQDCGWSPADSSCCHSRWRLLSRCMGTQGHGGCFTWR